MLGLLTPALVSAHSNDVQPGQWNFDPLVTIPLVLISLGYLTGLIRLWHRAGIGRGVPRWQVVMFVLGLLTLGGALLSPLEGLGEISFAAHMTQHILLVIVAAPLMILGKPLAILLLALPGRWRLAVTHNRPVRAMTILARPVPAMVLYGLALWLWHAPLFYQAAIVSNPVHIAEHVVLLVTALLFWWSVIHARRGIGLAGLFFTMLHNKLLGILIALAPYPLYPVYSAAINPWGLTAGEDQHLAGLIMLIPGAVVYIAAGLTLLGLWLQALERRPAALSQAWLDRPRSGPLS